MFTTQLAGNFDDLTANAAYAARRMSSVTIHFEIIRRGRLTHRATNAPGTTAHQPPHSCQKHPVSPSVTAISTIYSLISYRPIKPIRPSTSREIYFISSSGRIRLCACPTSTHGPAKKGEQAVGMKPRIPTLVGDHTHGNEEPGNILTIRTLTSITSAPTTASDVSLIWRFTLLRRAPQMRQRSMR